MLAMACYTSIPCTLFNPVQQIKYKHSKRVVHCFSAIDLTTGERTNSGAGEWRKGVKYLADTTPNNRKLPPEYVLPLPENPLVTTQASVPVIDIGGLDGSPQQRHNTVLQISSACATGGFFRISNHGVKISLMEEMMDAVDSFFNLEWDEKMKYASTDVMDPVRYGTSLNTSVKHDLHWRDYLRHFGYPFEESFHLWPNNPPNYRYIAKEYLEEVRKVALKLAGAMSEGLGLDINYIQRSFGGVGCQIVACNYYPPCPEPDKTLGLSPHSDHGGITILMDNDEGLQIKHGGEWFCVKHIPGTFVVNLGDCLEILSCGKYKSIEHRAVVNERRARISVAASQGPALSAIIAPAKLLMDEKSGVQYRDVTYQQYLRIQQTKPIREKSALAAIIIPNSNSA